MILNNDLTQIIRKAILLGDEIGIPVLSKIANDLGIKILGLGFSKKVTEKTQLEISGKLGIPLVHTKNEIDTNLAILEFTKINDINLILMFSYDVILDNRIINVPELKIINIHGGKVPKYRGANVLNWAIINGEKEIGITIHEAKIPVDSGPIIGEWSISVDYEDTAYTVREKISTSIFKNLPEILTDFFLGKIKPKHQSDLGIVAHKKRHANDGIFDWSYSDQDIYNLVRALVDPWPGARFIDRKGNLVIINKYMSMEDVKLLRRLESN
jgi:methionyl-tRNA formyltransferase